MRAWAGQFGFRNHPVSFLMKSTAYTVVSKEDHPYRTSEAVVTGNSRCPNHAGCLAIGEGRPSVADAQPVLFSLIPSAFIRLYRWERSMPRASAARVMLPSHSPSLRMM